MENKEPLESIWIKCALAVITSGYGSLQHSGILSEHAIEVADAVAIAYERREPHRNFTYRIAVAHEKAVELQRGEDRE